MFPKPSSALVIALRPCNACSQNLLGRKKITDPAHQKETKKCFIFCAVILPSADLHTTHVDPHTGCGAGYSPIDGDCFKFFNTEKSFREARASCARENCTDDGVTTRTHLATIGSLKQHKGVVALINPRSAQPWIGLWSNERECTTEKGKWVWRSTNSSEDARVPGRLFTHWGTAAPDCKQPNKNKEAGAFITTNNMWEDDAVTTRHTFVCSCTGMQRTNKYLPT